MKTFKTTLVIITIFSLIMTILLIMAKQEGLHPNFKTLAFIIPLMGLMLWARLTIANTKITKK